MGAPRVLTHGPQLEEAIEIVRYYADLLPGYPMTQELGLTEFRGQQHRRWVEKEPAGVVAAIIGYNYPTQLALAKLSPALAAGCTVVLKGAPDTPLITLALGELIAEHTDIPAGVVNILTSTDVAVGEALTTSPDVNAVTFTGSTATGRRIMAAASSTSSASSSSSAASPPLSCSTAPTSPWQRRGVRDLLARGAGLRDPDQDAGAARAARRDRRPGRRAMGHVTYGDPSDSNNYMGPLISERQRDKVDGMVRRAVEAGATLVTGGQKVDGPGTSTPRRCSPMWTRTARSRRKKCSGRCW